MLALLVGVAGGVALHAWSASGFGTAICVVLGLVFASWPLGWMATMRIVQPMRDLAIVAEELRGGKLDVRARLPDAALVAEDEVGEVAGALRGMADRVARQLADQRALMATVSHELRSPLARVRVLVEMMREGTAPPGAHDDVQAEIDGMDALVGDLLAAARIDFEALSPRELDVLDLTRRALDLAGLPAESLVVVGAPGRVKADATLVARAVAGLLDNARRYGASAVVLRVVDHGPAVRLEVLDDGPGFVPGEEKKAFEPFWRGTRPDGNPAPRGEGLGLALVRQVAVAHGGEVGAANRPEGGARVWIEVPRNVG
jgi:signal transduction histidine kinase